MLGKLLKYETKATARLFLPLYAALLLFAIANGLLNPLQPIDETANLTLKMSITMISGMVYFGLIIGIVVMTIIIMIQRFYKNLLGDEGYLMFTLPVKTWQHVLSKLIVSVMWTILSFATVVGSVLIIVNSKEFMAELPQVFKFFKDAIGTFGLIIVPVYALVAITSNIVMIYNAISLGHLFPKHRLLASFGMYCALYVCYQILMVIFFATFGNTIFTAFINMPQPTPYYIGMFILAMTIMSALLIALNFTIVNYILKKKLNLE